MWPIIIGAIVKLLIWFFEQWWQNHTPFRPSYVEKAAFLQEVGRLKYFWMGPNRGKYAGLLFDKFTANYSANPPNAFVTATVLSADDAQRMAQRYAFGLSLTPEEAKAEK